MSQLISKGGFRERANRSRKYRDSENEKTTLVSNKYQPNSHQQPSHHVVNEAEQNNNVKTE
ncbi:hypothetical protein [Acinetobacter ihumii]|uniref:hypothetical protein n=1 Tax=Acinetobacter ihumii TaxID=2483802 RepID=UPI00102F59FF|nr:hypothetical protein [Acinetobacter ihumii]